MDQKIQILIETVYNGRGNDQAKAAQAELNALAKQGHADEIEAAKRHAEFLRREESASSSALDPSGIESIRLAEEKASGRYHERITARSAQLQERAEEAAEKRRAMVVGPHDAHVQDYKAWLKQPKPPPLPEPEDDKKPFSGKGIGRFAGIMSRNPGASYIASLGKISAVGIALKKVVDLTKEWFNAQRALRLVDRHYQTIADRLESIGTLTNRIKLHNDELALSYTFIERHVRSTQAMVSQFTELGSTQISNEKTLLDLAHEKELAQIRLTNLFNPIGKLMAEQEANDRYHASAMAIEEQSDQLKISALEEQTNIAAAKKTIADATAAQVNEELANLQTMLKVEKERLEISKTKFDMLAKRHEAVIDPLGRIAKGNVGPGDIVRLVKSTAGSGEWPSAATAGVGISGVALSPLLGPMSWNNPFIRGLAKTAIAQEEEKKRSEKASIVDPQQRQTDSAESFVKQAETVRSEAEQEAKTQETLRQDAAFKLEQQKIITRDNTERRSRSLQLKEDINEINTRSGIQGFGQGGNSGGPNLGSTNGSGTEKLESLMERMIDIWKA